jgi:hypothetical protein
VAILSTGAPEGVFACVQNAGRSQMAAAKRGCGDACPVIPGKRYLDRDRPDPSGLPVERVRPIRDEIDRRVRGLIAEPIG